MSCSIGLSITLILAYGVCYSYYNLCRTGQGGMVSSNRFLLVYGSQTGQSKAIAEEIAERCDKAGIDADIHCLGKIEKEFVLEKESLLVMVVSTTGDGEPPDTALKFWRRVKRKTLLKNHFSSMKYSLLGLGDSNYSNYCRFPHMANDRLLDLGATHFVAPGFADDAVGLEVVVEPWIDSLLISLCSMFDLDAPSEENKAVNGAKHLLNQAKVNSVDDITELTEQMGSKLALTSTANGDTINGNSNLPLTSAANGDTSNDDSNIPLTSTANGDTSNDDSNLPLTSTANGDTSNDDSNLPLTSAANGDISNGNSNLTSALVNTQPSEIMTALPSIEALLCQVDNTPAYTPDDWTEVIPSICSEGLMLPSCPASYIHVEYLPDSILETSTLPLQNNCKLPFANSSIYLTPVSHIQLLTADDDSVKKTLLVQLDRTDLTEYRSGDSFSIVAQNNGCEVEWLLTRLAVTDPHQEVKLSVSINTTKKRAAIPEYLNNPSTLHEIFTRSVDIRFIPKKAVLRLLAEHCSDVEQQQKLLYLSSKQGADLYRQMVVESKRGLLDILHAFPSCTPPIQSLLENLPRLLPRAYSVASASQSTSLRFAFSVIDLPSIGPLTDRHGLVTGRFDNFFKRKESNSSMQVQVYLRTQQHFRLPADHTAPLILIGPGSGVAPFLGFLQDREKLLESGEELGDCLLFFGNRLEEGDYLFREEFAHHLSVRSLTKLFVCFSRDASYINKTGAKYVTDLIRQQSSIVSELVTKRSAYIYVCGDAKNMAKDVNQAITEILQSENGYTNDEVVTVVKELRHEKRYKEDVWT